MKGRSHRNHCFLSRPECCGWLSQSRPRCMLRSPRSPRPPLCPPMPAGRPTSSTFQSALGWWVGDKTDTKKTRVLKTIKWEFINPTSPTSQQGMHITSTRRNVRSVSNGDTSYQRLIRRTTTVVRYTPCEQDMIVKLE